MRIDYHAFSFSLTAKEIILLPSYKGSTLRGGFGNAFRKIVCALRKSDCTDCILKEKCVYSYVFETPPPSDTKMMTKYTNAPHPFIIEPPPEKRQAYKPGDDIIFGLTLVGRALDYLPYFVYTFDELGKMGIGKDRGKYELKEVREAVNSHESEVSFFDSVDHELMREKIRRYIGDPTLRVLIEGWLSAEVWDGEASAGNKAGDSSGLSSFARPRQSLSRRA